MPNLEVMVTDGTGTITAVFAGRRRIAGIEHGRAIVLEGVAVDRGDRAGDLQPGLHAGPVDGACGSRGRASGASEQGADVAPRSRR